MVLNLQRNGLQAIDFIHLRVTLNNDHLSKKRGIVIGQTNLGDHTSPRLTIRTDEGKILEGFHLNQVRFETSALDARIQRAYREANDLQGLQQFLNKTTS